MRPEQTANVAAILRHLARQLQAERSGFAHVPLDIARLMTDPTGDGCRSCGGRVEPVRMGRPRIHCEGCHPPRRAATKSPQSAA